MESDRCTFIEAVVRKSSVRSVLGEAKKPVPGLSAGLALHSVQRPHGNMFGLFRALESLEPDAPGMVGGSL